MKKKSLLLSILALILLLILSSGCSTTGKPLPADSKPIVVYTTIYPLNDFTKKIGGDRVEVINVIPLGAQPHSFEPSTKMVAELSHAKLLIYNGAGMEHYIPKSRKPYKVLE